jgi:hypothetical protein
MMQVGSTLVLVAPLFFVERQLNSRVEQLAEEVAGIRFTSNVPITEQHKLAPLLRSYQLFMSGLGYEVEREPIEIRATRPEDNAKFGVIAYYDSTQREMRVQQQYVAEPAVILREYSHHLLNMNTTSPMRAGRGPWGRHIGSALAFYFPSASTNDPRLSSYLGKGSLADPVAPEELAVQRNTYTDPVRLGWEWARMFWLLRTRMRAADLDAALAATWASGPSYEEGPYPVAFLSALARHLKDDARAGTVDVARQTYIECDLPWLLPAP